MGPSSIGLSAGVGERDICAVKGDEKVGGVPYFCKRVDDGRLAVMVKRMLDLVSIKGQ